MQEAITVINILGAFALVVYFTQTSRKLETERFRDFVRAIKSKDVGEYNIAVTEDSTNNEDEILEEFEDPYEADPNKVLAALKKV